MVELGGLHSSADTAGDALAALKEHHPQKWDIYRRCVQQGQPLKDLVDEIGLSAGTLSQHLTDARQIIAAFQITVWDPRTGPFSFAKTAQKLGVTENDLRHQLTTATAEARLCPNCHELFYPKKNCGASEYCSRGCRHRAYLRRQGSTCGYEGCTTSITDDAQYCPTHHLTGLQTGTCQMCGDAFQTCSTNQLYCSACKPVADRERSNAWRQTQKTPCLEQGCAALVSRATLSGFCRLHAIRYIRRQTCKGCGKRYRPSGWGQRRCLPCASALKRDRDEVLEEQWKHRCAGRDCKELVTRKSTFCAACRPDRGGGAKARARQELQAWEQRTEGKGGPDELGRPVARWLVSRGHTLTTGATDLGCPRNTLARFIGYPQRTMSPRPAACRRMAKALASKGALGRDEEAWARLLLAARPPGAPEARRRNAARKRQQRNVMATARKAAAQAKTRRAAKVCERTRAGLTERGLNITQDALWRASPEFDDSGKGVSWSFVFRWLRVEAQAE